MELRHAGGALSSYSSLVLSVITNKGVSETSVMILVLPRFILPSGKRGTRCPAWQQRWFVSSCLRARDGEMGNTWCLTAGSMLGLPKMQNVI